MVTLLEERDIPAERSTLDVGDYMWYEGDEIILVTRKASDLLDSLFSDHFQDELECCVNLIQSVGQGRLFAIIEGPWASGFGEVTWFKRNGATWFKGTASHRASSRLLPGLYLSLHLAGIGVVYTTSLGETADALAVLYNRGREGWSTEITRARSVPPLHFTTDKRVAKLMALCPRMPEKVAIRLMRQFGSVAEIVHLARTDYTELLEIQGFGKGLLKSLQESIL